jgi:NADH-quinone oxidoreductase subunit N
MNSILALTVLGVIAMISEIFRIRKQVLYPVVVTGLAIALVLTLRDWNTGIRYYSDMMFFDNYAVAFSSLIIAVSLLWHVFARDFMTLDGRQSDHTALISFATAGGVVMVSYADLTMLFIGIEILSIAMYVMSASNKENPKSNEAGFKYFLMGAFATGFLLFGITLIYGASGSFNLQEIAAFVSGSTGNLPSIFYAGILLITVGLAFKVAAAPFHFWAPDVYDGAPTPVTAFMSTVVKIAAFAAFLRLFMVAFSDVSDWWGPVLATISALSILGGNLLAVFQTSLKRMMAYSSIAHAGYMLMAIVAMNDLSQGALLLYLGAYSFASVGLFTVIQSLTEGGNEQVSAMKGFAKVHHRPAFALVLLTLSMAGIPPVAGFFAKYYMFYAALESGYAWLVLVAVIGSLIGVYYYFRIIITMYQPADRDALPISMPYYRQFVLWVCVAATILLGLAPAFLSGIFA